MKKLSWFFLLLTLPLLIACESSPKIKKHKISDANIVAVIHQVADALLEKSKQSLTTQSPLIIASFVDIDRLDNTSSFGRMVSQQMGSAISSKGYVVKEMLLRKNVYIKQAQGEFLLSRQLRNISSQHNAQAVVVGTYAVGRNSLYATAKIISATSNTILASHDFVLPLGPDVKELLRR